MDEQSADKDKAQDSGAAEKPQSLVFDLNFTPDWARKPPENGGFGNFEDRPQREYRDNRGGGKSFPPRRDGPDSRPRKPRPAAGKDPRRDGDKAGGRDSRERGGGFRPRPARDAERAAAPVREYAPLPPVDVRFIPDQQGLSSLIRQVHAARKAYPLMQMASMFLNNPDLCVVKIEPQRGSQGIAVQQCKICGMISTASTALIAHIIDAHAGDYFDREEVLGEPPAGQFVCIARCGLTGTLLGPPNHHSYGEKVLEVHKTRFPDMPLDVYKKRIEMRREPELIEKWKEESRKQILFKLKSGGETAEKVKRAAVEAYMLKNVVPESIVETRRISVLSKVARQMEDSPLKTAIRLAWQKESRFPISVALALRGAFRHRNLFVFKAARGLDYVTAIKPAPLDPQHVVDAIKVILVYLKDHSGAKREEILKALHPAATAESPEAGALLSQITWLIEKGHIIEYFNGTLSVPPPAQPERREQAKPAAAAQAPAAAAEKAPDQEAPEAAVAEVKEAATAEPAAAAPVQDGQATNESAPAAG